MLTKERKISKKRKRRLKQTGILQEKQSNARSAATKSRRMTQANIYISKLQKVTHPSINVMKAFTMQSIAKDDDIYESIKKKMENVFKKEFQSQIKDFNNDYIRTTKEAFLNVINHFSQRGHLNARKQILLQQDIVINEESGMGTYTRARKTNINGVSMISGNSKHTNSKILDTVYDEINQSCPWDDSNLLLIKRNPVGAIETLLQTYFNSTMIGTACEFNRNSVSIDDIVEATADDADIWPVNVGDAIIKMPKQVWIVGKGDEASGVRNLPLNLKHKALFFFFGVVLMQGKLSQSRHAAVGTIISGLTSTNRLLVKEIKHQVI